MGDPIFTRHSFTTETERRGISFESDGRASKSVAEKGCSASGDHQEATPER